MQQKTDSFNQILPEKSEIPAHDLFFSDVWLDRFQLTRLNAENALPIKYKKLNIYSTLGQELADYEEIPTNPETLKQRLTDAKKNKSDWLVFRKLRNPSPGTILYSHAPYLDLTKPIELKKEVSSHLARTERKITRELGPIRVYRAQTQSELEAWFSSWKEFHSSAGHFDEERFQIYHQWIFGAPLPAWILPMAFEVNNRILACGLFYEYQSVFYYFSPTQNQAPEFRKYGLGKLFTQKLIEKAQANGCTGFDFLQGAYSYKMTWNPELRPLYQKIIPLTFWAILPIMRS